MYIFARKHIKLFLEDMQCIDWVLLILTPRVRPLLLRNVAAFRKRLKTLLIIGKKKPKNLKKILCQVLFVGNQIMDGTYFWKCAHVLRITQSMVQAPRARWVDIDAISYTTQYTTKMKANFSSLYGVSWVSSISHAVPKSSLMNLRSNQEHHNRAITVNVFQLKN